MCEIVSAVMAGVGLAVSIGSGIAEAVGNANAGAAAEKQAQTNKGIAEEAAADARARGEVEASNVLSEAGQVVGEQVTQFADSGVVVSSGTAADIQAATSAEGKLRALTVQNNAIREAWGFKNEAQGFDVQAKQISAETGGRVLGSVLSTTGAAAKGVANVYNSGREFGLWKKR